MPPGRAEFPGQTTPPWPAGCPCPIDHRRPKVRDTFTCEEVLRSRIGKALGFHGRNDVYLFLPFVSQSQGNRGTLKISRKLLPAAPPCSELQNEVFAEDRGKWGELGCVTWVTPPGAWKGEEDPLSSPTQSTWKTSLPVGTWRLPHPGQRWAPGDGRR